MSIRNKIGRLLEIIHLRRFARAAKYYLYPSGFLKNNILFPLTGFLRVHGWAKEEDMRISKLKNIHQGKRCFIIATGPSLTIEDVNLLKDEYTIGINSIFGMYEKMGWLPTYYTILDDTAVPMYMSKGIFPSVDKLARNNCFINSNNKDLIKGDNVVYLHLNMLDHMINYGSHYFKYNPNLLFGIYDFYTVAICAIEIAMYLGFKEIYLIGLDNNYCGEKMHYSDSSWDLNVSYEVKLCTQNTQAMAFEKMREYAEKEGVRIYNATRGGRLEAFPRVKLEELF